jgi:colanic acid biosynthesis glycosyl transferase WcaI
LRILVISMLYAPDHAGIAPIATDLVRGLAERGHDVTVCTTHPYYPEWRRKSDDNPWRVKRELVDGVRVERYGLFVPSKPSRLLPRLAHELSFPLSLLRGLYRLPRFDATVVFCPLFGAVAYAAVRKLLRAEPLWINVQDIPVDAAAGTGIGRAGPFLWLAARIQARFFAWADSCSSISPSMVERLAAARPRARAVHLRPNWLCGSLASCVDALPSKVGRAPAGRLKLLYAGNIGRKQGLLDFCKRVARSDVEFEFRIHGEGAESAELRAWIESLQDARFRTGGFLEEPAFVQALHETDLFVITEKAGAGASFLPSKLIPCIATGTPVLCICDREGPLGHEVTAHGLGLLAQWQDDDWLAGALALGQDPQRFRRLQENCVQRARAFRREQALDDAELLLRQLVKENPKWVRPATARASMARRTQT